MRWANGRLLCPHPPLLGLNDLQSATAAGFKILPWEGRVAIKAQSVCQLALLGRCTQCFEFSDINCLHRWFHWGNVLLLGEIASPPSCCCRNCADFPCFPQSLPQHGEVLGVLTTTDMGHSTQGQEVPHRRVSPISDAQHAFGVGVPCSSEPPACPVASSPSLSHGPPFSD